MTELFITSIEFTPNVSETQANIVITFNAPILLGSGEFHLRSVYIDGFPVLSEDIATSTHVTISGNTLTLDPPNDLHYGSRYQLILPRGAVRDAAGTSSDPTDSIFAVSLSPVAVHAAGTGQDEWISGSTFADALSGAGGDDELVGIGGDDTLLGGSGRDRLHGGEGDDFLAGGDGDDLIDDEYGSNVLIGGAGNDNIRAGGNMSKLSGGEGDDFLLVSRGDALVDGGSGDDMIYIAGTEGVAAASGGAGSDTYVFAPDRATVIDVADFAAGAGGDVLDPYHIFTGAPAANLFQTGHLRLQQSGRDTLVQIDLDGSAGGEAGFNTVVRLRNTNMDALTSANFTQGLDPSGSSKGMMLSGTGLNDALYGGVLDDTMTGGAGNDQLQGDAGNDTLDGGTGNDDLWGEAGRDVIAGGDGLDTAVYSSILGAYTIKQADGALRVEEIKTGLDSDTLSGVERLRFLDLTWALDVGADGNAGQVYRLYQAAFDRKPDAAGLGYWLVRKDAGFGMEYIAEAFTQSEEFHKLYGDAPTNAELVTHYYDNVLHRAPDAGGHTYWVDVLDRKQATAAQVLNYFSESRENVEAVAAIIGDGYAFRPAYFGID